MCVCLKYAFSSVFCTRVSPRPVHRVSLVFPSRSSLGFCSLRCCHLYDGAPAYRLLRRYGALHGAELHLEKSLFGGIRALSFSSFFSPEASTAAVTPGFCYTKTEGLYPSPPPGIDTQWTSPSLPATVTSGRTSSPEFDLFSRPVSSSPSSKIEEILRGEQEREERRRAGKDVDWDEELDLWRKFNRDVSPAAWERMCHSRPDAAFQRRDKNTGSLSSRRTSSDGGRKRKTGGLGRLHIEQEDTGDEEEQGAREEKEENEEDRGEGVSRRRRRKSRGESERDESDNERRDGRRGSREKRRHRSREDNEDRQGVREQGKGARAKKGARPRKSVDAQHVVEGKAMKQGERGIRQGDTRAKAKGGGTRRSTASSPDAAGAKTEGRDQGRKEHRTKKAGEDVVMKKKAIPAGPGEQQAVKGTGNDVARKTGRSGAPAGGSDRAALVKQAQEELNRRGGQGGGRTKYGGGPPPPRQGKKQAVGPPPSPGSKKGAKKPAGPPGQKKVLSAPGKPPVKKSPEAVAAPHG